MRLRLLVPADRVLLRRLVVAMIVPAALVLGIGLGSRARVPEPASPRAGVGPVRPVPEIPDPWPLSLIPEAARQVEDRLRPGSNLASVLRTAGLDAGAAADVARAARDAFDIRRLRAGRPYEIYFDADDAPMLFRYRADRQTAWVVVRAADGWRGAVVELPVRSRPIYVRAAIYGSLEGSLARTLLGRQGAIDVAQKIADLFAWDVDFAADLQPGDRVDLVIEQRTVGEELVGYGDLLAAELTFKGGAIQAVRFLRPSGAVSYFAPDGESIRRAFLRSPVAYTRISSRFTNRRYHPILKVHRPHNGVDYVAPPGTPVRATSDGTVVFAGRNGGAGNQVRIRHGGSYTSEYLHLSRFAQGLRVGDQVEQGQTIGHVGRTGLATSYHLHYQLRRSDGGFVDPLRVQFPAADPVPEDEMEEFVRQRDRWFGMLQDGKRRASVQLAGGGS